MSGELWTREALEKELPGGTPLVLEDVPDQKGRRPAYWKHPRTGTVWRLEFDGDKLMGASVAKDHPFQTPWPSVRWSVPNDIGEQVRSFAAFYARRLWLCVLAAWVLAKRLRGPLGHLLLATAIVGALADLAHPGYLLEGTFSNDGLALDTLAVAATVAAIAASSEAGSRFVTRRLLPRRFNLRWMFGVTALVAVLVSFRENGLVIAGMIVAAAIFFALFSLLVSRGTDHS